MSLNCFELQMFSSTVTFNPVTIDITALVNEISYEDIENLTRDRPTASHTILTHLHNIMPYVQQLGLKMKAQGQPAAKTVTLNIKLNNDIIPVKYFAALKKVEYQNLADRKRSIALPLYGPPCSPTSPSSSRSLPARKDHIPLDILIMGVLHGGNIMAHEDEFFGCKDQPFSWREVQNLVRSINPDKHPTRTAKATEDLKKMGLLSHNHSPIQAEPHLNLSAYTLTFPSTCYNAALYAHAQQFLLNFSSPAIIDATMLTETRTEDQIECDNQNIIERFKDKSSQPLDNLSKEFEWRVRSAGSTN
jgi:hypothetical protein